MGPCYRATKRYMMNFDHGSYALDEKSPDVGADAPKDPDLAASSNIKRRQAQAALKAYLGYDVYIYSVRVNVRRYMYVHLCMSIYIYIHTYMSTCRNGCEPCRSNTCTPSWGPCCLCQERYDQARLLRKERKGERAALRDDLGLVSSTGAGPGNV